MVLCAEPWVPGSSSQEVEADLFEWVEVESCELEPPCTMINNTSHTFDLAGEARRRGWCEHELMHRIFEFGVPEGLRSMEAHMKALASVGEGSESVLQGRRILELAVEEDEANSVVFLGVCVAGGKFCDRVLIVFVAVAVGCQWRDQCVEPSAQSDG